MNISYGERIRLKKLAQKAKGLILDIGFNAKPNVYLHNADGLDVEITSKPSNYNTLYILNEDYTFPIESGVYDNVIAGEVIEHVLNLELFFNEISRILKSGGKFIFSTPNPIFYSYLFLSAFNLFYKGGKKGDHVHLFCKGDIYTLSNIFNFDLLEIRGAYFKLRKLEFPLPNFLNFLCFQHIYCLRKK